MTTARGQSSRSRMPASASGRTRRPACSTRSTRRSRTDWAWGCPSAARSLTIIGDDSGRRTRATAPPFTSLCRGYDDVGCGGASALRFRSSGPPFRGVLHDEAGGSGWAYRSAARSSRGMGYGCGGRRMRTTAPLSISLCRESRRPRTAVAPDKTEFSHREYPTPTKVG